MARWVDYVTEGVAYGLATAFVILLLIGPKILAEDEPAAKGAQAAYAGDPAKGVPHAGRDLFVSNCGACHTLKAAGTTGAVGPVLDGRPLDLPTIANTVRKGRGSMPAFGDSIAAADIAAVAAFVAAAGAAK